MRRIAILLVTILAAPPLAAPQSEDLNVLTRWIEWADAPARLQLQLNSVAFDLLERRRAEVAQLRTADDWESRRTQVRAELERVLGRFSERSQLWARVVGSFED